MQKTLLKIIETDINPFVDQWEKEGQYPAHQVLEAMEAYDY
jgi:citronellyl-CoA dehydrogenase